MSEAFVYLWRNAKTKRFYLGSHKGTNKKYTHSSDLLPDFSRHTRTIPDHWTRRILAYGTESEMHKLERKLQLNRKAKCWDRYYNVQVSNNGREHPPINFLHECFDLDVDTGQLIWKARPVHHFKTTRGYKMSNTRYVGKEAGQINSLGYRKVAFTWNGKGSQQWLAHRIVWAMHYGQWPTKNIDHIDGNKANNAITNLREVTVQENMRNRGLQKNNTSGHPGVHWDSQRNKWVAQIFNTHKTISLGYFPDINDAITARKSAEKALGFHENHGRN